MKRWGYNIGGYHMYTGELGYLYPICWRSTLPGDTFQISTSILVRLATLVAPIMHPLKVRVSWYYVPYRIMWDDWPDFITGDETVTHPYFNLVSCTESSIYDYLGIPVAGAGAGEQHAVWPIRAYDMIVNEFYLDQELDTLAEVSTAGGQDTTTDKFLYKVRWGKDYLTTARTSPVMGETITIPVSSGTPDYVTIEDLRLGKALYRYAENRQRYGNRYSELLNSFGVRGYDSRIDLPVHLGSSSKTVSISEVLQTAEGTESADVGTMRGHGISAMRTKRMRFYSPEHGIVMGLADIRPLHIWSHRRMRDWFKNTKEDYFQRELAGIGDQTIRKREVWPFASFGSEAWGYQARYDEYRGGFNQISGGFWDEFSTWHFARMFGSYQALNAGTVRCDVADRPFADYYGEDFLAMSYHSIQALRVVPPAR